MRILGLLLLSCSSTHHGPDASLDASVKEAGIRDSARDVEADLDAPVDAAPDGCGDTTSDPSNCGACGHDCLGGTCTNGKCDRVLLLNTWAADIVLGPNDVYFISGTTDVVGKCAKTGCNLTPTWLSQGGSMYGLPNTLATDQKTLFWTQQSVAMPSIESIPIGGGTVTFFATGQTRPYGIATDGTQVFWTADGEVRSCPIGGCTGAPTVLAPVYGAGYDRAYVTADATNVYFVSNGAVSKCPVAGCNNAPTTLFSVGPYDLCMLATDSTNLYATCPGGIYRCAVAGCNGSPTLLYKTGTLGFATDGADLYFGEAKNLIRCSVNGCFQSPIVMSHTDMNTPSAIAVDSKRVFFCDGGVGNAVYWVAK